MSRTNSSHGIAPRNPANPEGIAATPSASSRRIDAHEFLLIVHDDDAVVDRLQDGFRFLFFGDEFADPQFVEDAQLRHHGVEVIREACKFVVRPACNLDAVVAPRHLLRRFHELPDRADDSGRQQKAEGHAGGDGPGPDDQHRPDRGRRDPAARSLPETIAVWFKSSNLSHAWRMVETRAAGFRDSTPRQHRCRSAATGRTP